MKDAFNPEFEVENIQSAIIKVWPVPSLPYY
jgi:hypothetical protein